MELLSQCSCVLRSNQDVRCSGRVCPGYRVATIQGDREIGWELTDMFRPSAALPTVEVVVGYEALQAELTADPVDGYYLSFYSSLDS
jgi:hypothetical protein